MEISRRAIGYDYPCFIIAEAGINHNGDFDLALELVSRAKDSGADCVKFQTFNTQACESKHALKPSYYKGRDGGKSKHEVSKSLEFNLEQFKSLKKFADKNDIVFLSTAADLPSLNLLVQIGTPTIKIGSSDTNNLYLLRHIAQSKLPVILSTGISNTQEVRDSVEYLYRNGTSKLALLQCTSNYPAPFTELNLRVLETYRKEFNIPVGLSDHSEGIHIPMAAVALGACIIEKHFTLSRNLPGVDHAASLEPDEFKEMVLQIRDVESAMGDQRKKIQQCETEHLLTMRKSIVAARPIKAGKSLEYEDITVKRPGTGLSPIYFDILLGKKVRVDLEPDDQIKVDIVDGL